MKTSILLLFILMAASSIFISCQDEAYLEYTANSPVYMSYDDLRAAVKTEDARTLVNPGKIYFKDDFIFINEYMKGVHVYDNSNPESPQAVAFINIPGNIDIVIRNNYLFADSYIDIVVLDISNLNTPIEVDRKTDIFDYTIPECNNEYEIANIDREKGVVIDWEVKKVKERIQQQNYYPIYWEYRYDYMMFDGAAKFSGNTSGGGSEFGVGGSMARFGQYENHLLVLKNNMSITSFDVSSNGKIVEESTWNVGWNIETMFIRNETMFIGSQQGMYIYNISDLPNYQFVSNFMHFTACDPVVADDHFAYITLRTGSNCGGGNNVLQIVDISQLSNPILRKTYQMTNPHGLGLDGDILFICDGSNGLKVYNAERPNFHLPLISHFSNIQAYDVIPLGNTLFLIGEGGFYQYDYSNLNDIKLISTIEVKIENQNP